MISLSRALGGHGCGWMGVSGCRGYSSESPGFTTLPSESNPQSDGLGGKLTVSGFISLQAAPGPGAGRKSNKGRTECPKVVGECVCALTHAHLNVHLHDTKKKNELCECAAAL